MPATRRVRPVALPPFFLDFDERLDDGLRRVVFLATYTSMITGRMTGLRWVTS